MCTQQQLQEINSRITQDYQMAFGDALQSVILFGSYARGDYDEESDIDYVAIVHGERGELQHKMEAVWDSSVALGMEHDVVISPTVIPASEFDRYNELLPYYRNIREEGILVG